MIVILTKDLMRQITIYINMNSEQTNYIRK